MPTRILRDGILESEAVCSLGWAAEVLYRRVMSVADDYGRFCYSATLLRAKCYPLQVDKVSDADVLLWLHEIEAAGLVRLYAVAGKQFLEVVKFGQQRRTKSKHPGPPDINPPAVASKCLQALGNDHLDGDVFGVGVEDGDGTCVESYPQPTRAASARMAIKAAGFSLTGVSDPEDPAFMALIEIGVTDAEFAAAAKVAVDARKGWRYLLGVVRGKREDAAAILANPGAPPPARASPREGSNGAPSAADTTARMAAEAAREIADDPQTIAAARAAAQALKARRTAPPGDPPP